MNKGPAASYVAVKNVGGWKRFAPWLIAVAGGVAGALAFDPVGWRWLIPLAPLACFISIRSAARPRGAFARAMVFGTIFYFGALQWLTSIRDYAPFPWLIPPAIVLLGAYVALFPSIGLYILRRWLWPQSAAMQFAAFAAVWLLAEYVRTLGRLAMPLAELGHAWAVWPAAIQCAAWLGELGVSLEVLWVAGLLYFIGHGLTHRKAKAQPGAAAPQNTLLGVQTSVCISHWSLPVCMIIVAILWIAASLLILRAWDGRVEIATRPEDPTPKLKVGLLQPNIDQHTKLFSYFPFAPNETTELAHQREIVEQMTALQESMLAQSAGKYGWGLVVLPETAFVQMDFATNQPVRERAAAMARRAKVDLALGASLDKSRAGRSEVYNSAYFVRANGAFDPRIYNKMRLVPFGESLPYFNLIPGFQENLVGIGTFAEGRDWTIFNSHGLRFGMLICFESTFSAMARGFVQRGADFIVVITNDAWYGLSAGAAQHHHLSLLRAVETRRWLARCANTGISSLITPAGRLAATLELNERGFVSGTLTGPLTERPTWFTRWGYSWLLLAWVLLIACGVQKYLARKRDSSIKNAQSRAAETQK